MRFNDLHSDRKDTSYTIIKQGPSSTSLSQRQVFDQSCLLCYASFESTMVQCQAAILVAVATLSLFFVLPLAAQVSSFPFYNCTQRTPSAYALRKVVSYKVKNTYCFQVESSVPDGCKGYCCTQADLYKLEINAKPECNVRGVVLSATLDGAPVPIPPAITAVRNGPANATILKLTQLGLNLTTANGAEVCITLRTNNRGQGCTNLTQLCVPPAGAPPGVCTSALFSSNNNCCPLTNSSTPAPPPPSSVTPITPGNVVCTTCVDFTLESEPYVIPYSFTTAQCNAYASAVAAGFSKAAADVGVTLFKNFTLELCSGRDVKVCGKFLEANGELLVPEADRLATEFLTLVVPGGATPPYLTGHTVKVTIASTSSNGARRLMQMASGNKCPAAEKSIPLLPNNVTFPKCICNTTVGGTPFAAVPFYTTKPHPVKASTRLYCFKIATITPVDGPCASANTISKVEFWVNDTTPMMRRLIKGFHIKPSNATNYTFISPTWSGQGEETVRATPLDWNRQQANGGEVCMEVDISVSLNALCLGPYTNGCYVNIFDKSKDCCPLYAAVDTPFVP